MAADVRNTAGFKALATQVSAELLLRGLDVQQVAVVNVLAHMVGLVAQQLGIQPRAALRYIEPGVVADQIAAAGDPDTDGAKDVHAVRPVRVDERRLTMDRWVPGRPLMALAQAAKYASSNGDTRSVQHALDLISELGMAVNADRDSDCMQVPVGLLDEAAEITDRAAQRIEADGWSSCPCGEDHGQRDLDAKVAAAFREDALRMRHLRDAGDD
ncbi:hypothetical protein [Streptacidiphilus sp. EB129]|uniref:hypothetical protein n=1 Tax=Streptacidiphilus sp. EB129 TaxID=3156262 RepID=UPI0035130AAF